MSWIIARRVHAHMYLEPPALKLCHLTRRVSTSSLATPTTARELDLSFTATDKIQIVVAAGTGPVRIHFDTGKSQKGSEAVKLAN